MDSSFRFLAACLLGAVTFPIAVAAAPIRAVSAIEADTRVVLPKEAAPKEDYARYYVLKSVRSFEDTPFTTTSSFQLPRSRRVWLGVFVRRRPNPQTQAAGIRVVSKLSEMPKPVHGGCEAVNVIADGATGVTLASWCNITDEPSVNGMPPPLPSYIPKDSPFQ